MARRVTYRRGVVAVMAALCVVPIIGIAALCMDGGMLLDHRRHVQATADAAALAAASDLFYHYETNNGLDSGGTAKASALSTAAANGAANDGSNSVVTVNIPPASGPFMNQAGYAEVIVTFNVQRAFSNVFGSGTIAVGARAVARGQWTSFSDAIIALDPTGTGLSGVGNSTAVSGATVVVDSDSSDAVSATHNVSMTAPTFDIVGSTSDSSNLTGTVDTGAQPLPDPLAYLPEPSTTGLAQYPSQNLKGDTTLNPGVYVGGISISKGTLTLNPGIYYIQNGSFGSTGDSASIVGSGVMIYLDNNSSINLAGKGSVNLSPMTSGPYTGVTLFEDRTSTNGISITGNGNMTITGTIYAASAAISIGGNGGANAIGSQLVAYDISLNGNGSINVSWNQSGTARTRFLGLVE